MALKLNWKAMDYWGNHHRIWEAEILGDLILVELSYFTRTMEYNVDIKGRANSVYIELGKIKTLEEAQHQAELRAKEVLIKALQEIES